MSEILVNPFKKYDKRKFKVFVSFIVICVIVLFLNLICVISAFADTISSSPTSFEDAISKTFSNDSYFYAFKGYDENYYVIQTRSSGVHWDGPVTETSQLKYENTSDCHSYNIWQYVNGDLVVIYSRVDSVINGLVTVYLNEDTPIGYGGLRPSSSMYVSPAMAKLQGETESYHGVKVFPNPSTDRTVGGMTSQMIVKSALNWTDYLIPLVVGLVVLVMAFRKAWTLLVRELKGV